MKITQGLFLFAVLCSNSALAEANQVSSVEDALHLQWIDPAVLPGDDFYRYANANWQKNNPIPPEYAAWSVFNIADERLQQQVHDLLIKASKDQSAAKGSMTQKVGDFYFSGMDEAQINAQGIRPLQAEFERIEQIKTQADLQKAIAHLHEIGVDVVFGFSNMQDFKDSRLMIAAAVQSGLGLPDRDYYLKPDKKFQRIREEYVQHIQKMFQLLGDNEASAAANTQSVMAIENALAQASMSRVAQRDPRAVYHMRSLSQVMQEYPNFDWTSYLRARDLDSVQQFNLAMPEFFKAANALFTSRSIEDWKSYLRWHLIDSYAPYLSQPFVDEDFKMHHVLTGTEKLLPRWKRVVATENAALGFAVGQLYVDRYFSKESKKEVLEMLKNIRAVLREDLTKLAWMEPATRQAALKKLDMMEERVGYPSKWRDYSALQVDRGPYVLNVMRANQFLIHRNLHKIGKPIDRTEWEMTPQTVNAYYDPSMNNLNLPAGILQSPFFDPKAPAAVNYGGIGFVMGHEMTHGFDDQGAQFDGQGNLRNWWTPKDLKQFKEATQCIVDQFSKYRVDGDLPIQGKLVVGEATADLGGIMLAYRAFLRSKDYQNAKTIDGLTPEQQFFLSAAHSWATNMRIEQLRNQVTIDPHPPAQYRVNGSLANMPEFFTAFKLPANSPMRNQKPCVIW